LNADLVRQDLVSPELDDDSATAAIVEGDAAAAIPAADRVTVRRPRGAIAFKLGVAILSGEFRPGDVLPGEIAFAESLKVSRSAYREAMQVLTAKGLVVSRPKTGTRVLPRDRWNLLDPDVLAWAFSGEPDEQLVRSLFELRLIIEPAAAGLAAAKRSAAELLQLEESLALMQHHTLEIEPGREADRRFHNIILRATRNDALVVLSASIGAAVSWTTQYKQRTRKLRRDPIPDHMKVYQAIAAGDAEEASRAMRTLVELAAKDTREAMEIWSAGSRKLARAVLVDPFGESFSRPKS
jgi:DNA-binding FadR family transcriptional regulator